MSCDKIELFKNSSVRISAKIQKCCKCGENSTKSSFSKEGPLNFFCDKCFNKFKTDLRK